MYENVAFASKICCVGPQVGTYCSIITESSPVIMQVKTELGILVRTYSFYPADVLYSEPYNQNTLLANGYFKPEVVSLKYVGPLNTDSYYDQAIFYTLERRAKSERTFFTYERSPEIYGDLKHDPSVVSFSFNSDVEINSFTLTGTVTANDLIKLSPGTTLILGPSSKDGFVGKTEKVIIENIVVGAGIYSKAITVTIKPIFNTNCTEYEYATNDRAYVEEKLITSSYIEYDSIIIRKWSLDALNNRLVLKQTYVKDSTDTDWISSKNFCVEHYFTSLTTSSAAHSEELQLANVEGLVKYDRLLLGPSSDVDNLNSFEEVYVHEVIGNTVRIKNDSYIAPIYDYVSGNSVTIFKNIVVLSEAEPELDSYGIRTGFINNKGILYKYNNVSGEKVSKDFNAIFDSVIASDWNSYYGTLSFIKGNNLIHYSLANTEVMRSQAIDNVYPVSNEVIPIYSLSFNDVAIYKFQKSILKRDDTGAYNLLTWSTYNFSKDTLVPFTYSVACTVSDNINFIGGAIYLYLHIRDQFGVGLINKNVWVSADITNGDPDGSVLPLDGYLVTDADGYCTLRYFSGYNYSGKMSLSVKVDGANISYGSAYVNSKISFYQLNNFFAESSLYTLPDIASSNNVCTKAETEGGVSVRPILSCMFPENRLADEGAWQGYPNVVPVVVIPALISTIFTPFFHKQTFYKDPPQIFKDVYTTNLLFSSTDNPAVIENIGNQVGANFLGKVALSQPLSQVASSKQNVSINYISRHITYGNSANVEINQFSFISEAVPAMWSDKNNVDTYIWIRLRPFASNLNPSTFKIKLREVSYAGDTDWYDVTDLGTISVFDAGAGLSGIDFIYYPTNVFKYSAIVYVSIEVYDTSSFPNLMEVNYWFKLIADYKSPFLDNLVPSLEAIDVSLNTGVSFDLLDSGEGVDLSTLLVYVNNRLVDVDVLEFTPGNYHVVCKLNTKFYYGQKVTVLVDVKDRSLNANRLYDGWSFYCIESSGPWIDRYSVVPLPCSLGIEKDQQVNIQVYATNMAGLDVDSIKLDIGGKQRSIILTPIIYRVS